VPPAPFSPILWSKSTIREININDEITALGKSLENFTRAQQATTSMTVAKWFYIIVQFTVTYYLPGGFPEDFLVEEQPL